MAAAPTNVSGEEDADILRGGQGADTLDGGERNDNLHGGQGNDTFVFNHELLGQDTIRAFDQGSDVIEVAPFLAEYFGELEISYGCYGAEIAFGEDGSILLTGIAHGSLTSHDLVFV